MKRLQHPPTRVVAVVLAMLLVAASAASVVMATGNGTMIGNPAANFHRVSSIGGAVSAPSLNSGAHDVVCGPTPCGP